MVDVNTENKIKCPCCGMPTVGVYRKTIDGTIVEPRDFFYACSKCGYRSEGDPSEIAYVRGANSIKERMIEELKHYSGIMTESDVLKICSSICFINAFEMNNVIQKVKTHDGKSWIVLVKNIEEEKSTSLDLDIRFDIDYTEGCYSKWRCPARLTRKQQDALRVEVSKFIEKYLSEL